MSTEAEESFVPHSHLPYGQEGSGFYSENTIGCYDVISTAQPLVIKAIQESSLLPTGPFVIADYGTADGGTSMFLMGNCIKNIREKCGQDKEIMIYYEDQASNDFRSLFKRIHGLLPGPPSFLLNNTGVYASCIGTGFFSQCLPCNSVHIGFSFTAMHWLSSRPCMLKRAIHHTGSQDEEEKKVFAEHAAIDWETIMLARSHELAKGGSFIVACFCVDEDGQYLGRTNRVKISMFERMTTLWGAMVTKGRITQDEYDRTTFNNYYRTVQEYSAPFKDPSSEVYKSGLRLVSIETKVVPCVYNTTWMREGKKGDVEAARAHAKWYVPTTRTWSNSVFRSALNDERSASEKDEIVDEFFQSYEDEVAAAPEDHAMDYVHAYLVIRKSD